MKRTGLNFYVEGQYVTDSDWQDLADPRDQDWIPFQNSDLHPFRKRFFTAWSQHTELTKHDIHDLALHIINLIDWLRQERDWTGFCATLWLHEGTSRPQRMFQWELC